MCKIFCVTNQMLVKEDFLLRIEKVAKSAPDGIILREKDLSGQDYKILAKKVMKICAAYEVPCILHTFIEEAQELECKAVHVPLPRLRTISEEEKSFFSVLGTSCHSVGEAEEAEKLGCTYLIAGHIFETDCKKGVPPRGLEFLKQVCKRVHIPVFAIGGIQKENIPDIKNAGAEGCCIMSGAMQCADPSGYLAGLREKTK